MSVGAFPDFDNLVPRKRLWKNNLHKTFTSTDDIVIGPNISHTQVDFMVWPTVNEL